MGLPGKRLLSKTCGSRHLLTTLDLLPQEQKGCDEAPFDITADTMDVDVEEEVATTATLVETTTTTTTTTWLTQHSLRAQLDLEPDFLLMGFLVEAVLKDC